MGHQVNFFLLPADWATIEAAIRVGDDVRFLQDRTPDAAPKCLEKLPTNHSSFTGYIVRSSELSAVQMRYVPEQRYWLIEANRSPVVELNLGFFDAQVLRRGRAYFASDFNFRSGPADPDFIRWGDRVMGRIKKQLRRIQGSPAALYISPAAEQWALDHGAARNPAGTEYRRR